MKLKRILLTALFTFTFAAVMAAPSFADGATYYVSPTGNDLNDGLSQASPLASLSAVYSKGSDDKTVILLGNTAYTDAPRAYGGNITIKGNTESIVLSLPAEISLKGRLKLDNLTLSGASTVYAGGNYFEVTDSCTSADKTARMTVYGGNKNAALTGDTDIRLFGGHYTRIYGGGNGGSVTGNTNVTVGGNVNQGDGIDDDNTQTISPCYIYGGGNNGAVSGKTNVTLTGNAVAKYIVGAGNGSGGLAYDTNILIEGGKVMNVYGGSHNAPLAGCDTHITMLGGLAEAIFGGCENTSMTGNTYVTLLGGDVSRRVYTGCYNNVSLSGWSSSYYVTGTTTLTIGKDVKLNSKNGLSSDNQNNMGVFSGSRIKSGVNKDEFNTIIYLDGCYSSQKSKIGEKSIAGMFLGLKSSEKYVVNAAAGGTVEGTNTAGVIKVTPNSRDSYALVGTAACKNGNASIGTGATNVSFPVNFGINSISSSKSPEGAVSVSVDVTALNVFGAKNPTLYCQLVDEYGVTAEIKTLKASTLTHSLTFDKKVNGASYTVKAFILDENLSPLCQNKSE